ncbi:ATP-binding cassette domain-containing protein [Sphingomonas sp. Mn802worker]|uniref:ATP-binding cassette domain-containing protein n=1 Tax=Sphingomonas sp. Mn802worker TaxID=629773 RepID=UPI0004779738|nr:ATP-binding cassette domain-containing protein [Sphingomonas sp. Mn802worker]
MCFDVDVTGRGGRVSASFEVAGGVTILFGPSGSGKTSVLDMIAGLLTPERGHVRVAGKTLFDAVKAVNLPSARRNVGYVFQNARLFPHKRVRANLLYGASSDARLSEVAAMLDLGDLLDRWPRTLSGGEAKRVAIGRALLSEPDFLLLDEPLASLDAGRRAAAMTAIQSLRRATTLPTLLVTHDREEAERLGDRIVHL